MLAAIISLLAFSYLILQNSWIQTQITERIAGRLSKQLNTTISVGKVNIGFFKTLYLEDVLIEDQNNDTLLYAQLIAARIDTLKIKKRRLSISQLTLKNNKLYIQRDSTHSFNFSFILNAFDGKQNKDTANGWETSCNSFNFNNLNINYTDVRSNKNTHFHVHNLNAGISDYHSISNSISFDLNHFSMNDGGNLRLENAMANVAIDQGKIQVSNFYLKSSHSELKETELELDFYTPGDSLKSSYDLHLRIGKSTISFRELGELLPGLKGMNQEVELSGLIYGDLNDLKGKNMVLNTGTSTEAILDFYVNDIMYPERMYLFFDLKQSATSFSDLANIRFPNGSKRKYLEFPESFYNAGIVKFKGNFSGFLTDFVTFGTLESEMGSLTTDILVMPEKEGALYYRGNLSTIDFDLGKLLQLHNLGKLTFSGLADGDFHKQTNTISGIFKGDVSEIEFNKYIYKNIKFDGILSEKMFDGLLSVNDQNLQFAFLGTLDLNKKIPRFDFDLNLRKALPHNLNLGRSFPAAEVAFNMFANFKGDKLDNLDGSIKVAEGYYKNRNGQVDLGGMELKTLDNNHNSLLFTSDFLDVSINGNYYFRSIGNAFQKILHHFIPSIGFELSENTPGNIFDYQINMKEINRLSKIFVPELELETPFILYGRMDEPNNYFEFNGSIPGVKYKNLWARHIFIGNQNNENDIYSSKFRISELFNRNGLKLYNFKIDSKVSDNVLENTISWSNFEELTYSGSLKTHTEFSRPDTAGHHHIKIEGLPSQIYIADTLWTIDPFHALIDSSSIVINKFSISHGKQAFKADGKITDTKGDVLQMTFQNIDLAYLDKYLNREVELEGIINGTLGIARTSEAPAILSNLNISNLRYKKQLMGDISLLSQWNQFQSTIDSELKVIRNKRQNLKAFGYIKPSTGEVQYYAEIDSLSLVVLETFMKRNFHDFKGTVNGKAEINGTLDNLNFYGSMLGSNVGLTVNATQVPYHFTDTVHFRNDTILFDAITVYDDENNPGKFDGTIVHQNFNNMFFDLSFSSERIRAMNTTSRDNEQFYGTAVANGKLEIKGADKQTKLTGTATSLSGTDIKISMESESTVEQYDFIEFVKTSESKTNDFFEEAQKERKGEYSLSLTIEATPDAKVQLIYNSQIGDIIKAQGEGILLFEMDNDGNMSLSGNYNPTKGDYLFTLQNVLNKRFTIEPEGSIIWSGDPYNAIINLKAIYKLKASTYDLLMNEENESQRKRIAVECIIELEDELINPTIGFDINFPNADERDKDELSPFFNTEEEMNKQILSLIVLGKFYTPEYLRGTYEAQNTNMLGTTASEVLSNQLSNWLSQIRDDWDIGVNYRPGNQVTDDEIEVALSTQILNDRVTLNGNIGNNVNQYGTANNSGSQIVGDFEMSVKLVPNGKILLKVYNRSNNNLIYETAPYTQGVGLSFKEEYNSIDELFKKIGSLFKKKTN